MYISKEKAKEYQHRWYLKHKADKIAKSKKYREDIRAWFVAFKATQSCKECTVAEINTSDNLVFLCPNHHWELDHNRLN